jgi:hypothetical protein
VVRVRDGDVDGHGPPRGSNELDGGGPPHLPAWLRPTRGESGWPVAVAVAIVVAAVLQCRVH